MKDFPEPAAGQPDLRTSGGPDVVGPAGRELDRLLADAEIPRDATYVTNVVNHFEQRGNRRIHAKPNRIEIWACLPWLREEIRQVDPVVVVALGATAVQAFLGTSAAVNGDEAAMVDVVEMVHKDDLEDRRGQISPATMRAIDDALRHVFSLS